SCGAGKDVQRETAPHARRRRNLGNQRVRRCGDREPGECGSNDRSEISTLINIDRSDRKNLRNAEERSKRRNAKSERPDHGEVGAWKNQDHQSTSLRFLRSSVFRGFWFSVLAIFGNFDTPGNSVGLQQLTAVE